MYRDPTDIMKSHWKIPEHEWGPHDDYDIPCARQYRNPVQPAPTRHVLRAANVTHDQLTRTEYCAVHLDAVAHSVLQEHHRTGRGWFINYQQMPAVLWERWLPGVLGIPVTHEMQQRMKQVTEWYSKGKGRLPPRSSSSSTATTTTTGSAAAVVWREDTTAKRALVTPAVHNAVRTFCKDTYSKLERACAGQRHR